MSGSSALAAIFGVALCAHGVCASAQMLPQTACSGDRLASAGFESHEVPDPSGGNTGTATGDLALSVFVPSLGGSRTYHLRVPPQYSSAQAWPLVVVLHGAPGSPSLADPAAQAARTAWAPAADSNRFIVLAPVASGPTGGGWNPPGDTAALFAAIDDVQAQYNIDRRRRLLWGFSAGGHFGHGIGLANATFFAAYAANAGVLAGYAGVAAPAAAARRIPLSVRVGSSDSLASFANSDRAVFASAGWSEGGDYAFTQFSGGHTYGPADIDAQWAFICRWARP